MNEVTRIEACARAAHEANLAYCLAIDEVDQDMLIRLTQNQSRASSPEWSLVLAPAVGRLPAFLRPSAPLLSRSRSQKGA